MLPAARGQPAPVWAPDTAFSLPAKLSFDVVPRLGDPEACAVHMAKYEGFHKWGTGYPPIFENPTYGKVIFMEVDACLWV